MPQSTLDDVVRYLRKVCAVQAGRDLSDGELLERFVAHRDDAAFTVLVHRHGPMVLGVCKRVLSDSQAAEDAFQATFLVLVRRAASLGTRKPVGGWLYSVAQRVATKARGKAAARRKLERQVATMPYAQPLDDATWQELRSVLDQELAKLPEKYRTPLVLCYFQSKSHSEVAKELGCPKTTLSSRVERGRELLRQRLVRRGVSLSAGAFAAALGEKALGAPVGVMLSISTVKGALAIAAGQAVTAGCLSAQALALAEEAMKGVVAINGKLLLVVLALGVSVGGAGLAGFGGMAHHAQAGKDKETQLSAIPILRADCGRRSLRHGLTASATRCRRGRLVG